MPANGRSFEYRGDLAERALPEILYTIDRFNVAGVIEAEKDGVVKSVHIKDGRVIHAASSDLNDSLGTFLRRRGRLTEDHYAEPGRVYDEIVAFLGLREWRPDGFSDIHATATSEPPTDVANRLRAEFAEANGRLSDLAGRDFGWDL